MCQTHESPTQGSVLQSQLLATFKQTLRGDPLTGKLVCKTYESPTQEPALTMAAAFNAKHLTTHPIPALRVSPDPDDHTTRPSDSRQRFEGTAGQWQDFENSVRKTFHQEINWNAGGLKSPHKSSSTLKEEQIANHIFAYRRSSSSRLQTAPRNVREPGGLCKRDWGRWSIS